MQIKNASPEIKTEKVEPKVENQTGSLLKVKVKSNLKAGSLLLQCH